MTDDLRRRLAAARPYLCTDARQRQGDLPQFLDAVLGAGVGIVQLREKGLEAVGEMAFLEVFRRMCGKHGALLAVHTRAGVAWAVGADVLHLGQQDLPVQIARDIVGAGPGVRRARTAWTTSAPARSGRRPPSPGVPPPGSRWSGMPLPWPRGGPGSRSGGSAWTTWTRFSTPGHAGSSWSGPSPRPPTRPPLPPSS